MLLFVNFVRVDRDERTGQIFLPVGHGRQQQYALCPPEEATPEELKRHTPFNIVGGHIKEGDRCRIRLIANNRIGFLVDQDSQDDNRSYYVSTELINEILSIRVPGSLARAISTVFCDTWEVWIDDYDRYEFYPIGSGRLSAIDERYAYTNFLKTEPYGATIND